MADLRRIRVVLVEPEGPLNVGLVARTMKNMGAKDLCLVNPKCPPLHPYAMVMASGALELLQGAKVVGSLEEAIGDCALVVGTTRRRRRGKELIPLREGAPKVLEVASAQPVAVLFGREKTGLTNEELSLCQLLLTIPSDPRHGSLNLAQAVAVVLYELRASAIPPQGRPPRKLAKGEELQGLLSHLKEVLQRVGFLDPRNPQRGFEELKAILLRAQLDPREVRLLRGVLRSIERGVAHSGGDANLWGQKGGEEDEGTGKEG